MREPKVIILGSSGMLGQAVAKAFKDSQLKVIELSRPTQGNFSFTGQEGPELANDIGIFGDEWIINCIGWIPQKATKNADLDRDLAFRLNSLLPKRLDELSITHGLKVIQIVTDCVFRGDAAPYSEEARQDADDLYGLSKREGELLQSNAMRIRASIIGPDANSSAGLFSWFLSQGTSSKLAGYRNHFWNGVTTLAMSKLFLGLVKEGRFVPGVHHWIPEDSVSKYQLLKLFRDHMGFETVEIESSDAPYSIDRRLSTINPEFNKSLWESAGYPRVPAIADLVEEMVREFSKGKVRNAINE